MAETNIEQNICEAIEIIVDKAVAQATYDKTIQATITSCIDESAGYYKLKYQDSIIYAYSLSTDTTYSSGTSVYVLVPASDMSNTKTIIGTVAKLGTNYIEVVEPSSKYQINGVNVITSEGEFGLRSYLEGGDQIVLYSKDNSQNNLIDVDTVAVDQYIAESATVICGAYFRTALPAEQQYLGDYGIVYVLNFKNDLNDTIYQVDYKITVNQMTGQPYNFVTAQYQETIYDLDFENFIDIDSIYIYCKDFPNVAVNPDADIFVSAPALYGATRLPDEELAGYSLTFITEKGTYFSATALSSDTLTIEAQLKDAGNIVNIDSQKLSVYWFSENASVTTSSQYYCIYGGAGWKCLNDYLLIQEGDEATEASVEWIPANKTLTVRAAEVKAKEVQYKCAIIYNSTVVSKTITVKNLGADYDVAIESDSGFTFYYGVGSPTLTCLTYKSENLEDSGKYNYTWAVIDSLDNYTVLEETKEENQKVYELKQELEEYEQESAQSYPELWEAAITQVETQLSKMKNETLVNGNVISNIKVSEIYNFAVYKCSVFDSDGDLIGTASVTLVNIDEASGYTLVMHNNSFTYKYDEAGVGPTSSSCLNPISLMPLSYTLYNCKGEDITDEVKNVCNIKWAVPTENTLLSIPDSYTKAYDEDGYAIYTGLLELPYTIATKYDISKNNNDIYLTIEYEGMLLSAKSDLTFVKEGETGTNGTEYSCKIVPYTSDVAPQYLLVSTYADGTVGYNYTFSENNVPFEVELYHSETRIMRSPTSMDSDEGDKVTISWKMLKNKYTSSYSDTSSFDINEDTGELTFNGFFNNQLGSYPANIVQAEVNIKNQTILYATFPILTIKYDVSDYDIKLKEYTGFLYATYTSDGQSPKYDNANPFTLTVKRLIDGIYCDVSKEEEYAWEAVGQVYQTIWTDDIGLEDQTYKNKDIENYCHWFKPTSSYDGWCVTNAIVCTIANVATIHIPVHLMLNRYGLASLNGWDGNSVLINEEDGGFILAPQVGAGHKENDNGFTGIVIGDIQESNNSSSETGLFGFYDGFRSIFLDSNTGKAVFGLSSGTQIVIDPSYRNEDGTIGSAQIKSGDYSTTNGTGLLIDFDEPEIIFGSGNFSVGKDGCLHAIDGYFEGNGEFTGKITASSGVIGGWNIEESMLYSTDKKYIALDAENHAIYSNGKNSFESETEGFFLGLDGISLGRKNVFNVTASGDLTATSATITGDITANTLECSDGTIGGWTIEENQLSRTINSGSYKAGIYAPTYISTSTIAFYVHNLEDDTYPFRITYGGALTATNATITGKITAESGTIGGWTIGDSTSSNHGSYLHAGSVYFYSDGYLHGGSEHTWYINNDGSASFTSINVDGATITNSTISGPETTIENVTIESFTGGNGTYRFGSSTANTQYVEISDGVLYCRDDVYIGRSGTGTIHIGTADSNTYINYNGDYFYIGANSTPTYFNGSYFSFQNGYLLLNGHNIWMSTANSVQTSTGGGSIYMQGGTLYGNTVEVTSLNEPSDIRLKELITSIPSNNIINNLHPVSYSYKEDSTHIKHFGFIAQEVEQILKNDFLDSDQLGIIQENEQQYKTLAYLEFIPLIVDKLQSQEKEIQELRQQIRR